MNLKTLKYTGALMLGMLLAPLAATAQELPQTDAQVRRVDRENQKITLKHGEIKNLDMPPMTMVFQVKDPAWLDLVKAGDQVSVSIDKIDGQYTVMSLQPK